MYDTSNDLNKKRKEWFNRYKKKEKDCAKGQTLEGRNKGLKGRMAEMNIIERGSYEKRWKKQNRGKRGKMSLVGFGF